MLRNAGLFSQLLAQVPRKEFTRLVNTIDKKPTAIIALANYCTYGADLGEWSNGHPPDFPEKRRRAPRPEVTRM